MAFTYGSEALNQLAQEVSREPADLSAKADTSALATTNAVVATKQTSGEPILLDAQVITNDTTLDPDIPYWAIDASSHPVTLTFPTVNSVEGRQFTVTALDSSNNATIAAQAGEFFLLAGKPLASVALVSGTTTVVVARTLPGFPPVWVSQALIDPVPPVTAFVPDTTMSNATLTLPDATLFSGKSQVYKNAGSAGHSVVVSPAGSDTINGAVTPVTIPDGAVAAFVRQDDLVTNWTTFVTVGSITAPPRAVAEDSTSADLPVTLPVAASSVGLLLAYENTGTGGHSVLISPSATDTIEGQDFTHHMTLTDGQTVTFVVEDGSTTNWLSIVKPVVPPTLIPPPSVVTVRDTTGGDVLSMLPAAASTAAVYAFKNRGTGGHLLVVAPSGADTIDGAGGVPVPDGKTAILAVESASGTNWVLLSLA